MTDTPTTTPETTPAPAPLPGTPEHDAAMVAKFQASQQPQGLIQKPSDTPARAAETPKAPDATAEEKPIATAEEAKEALEGSGIQFDALQAEYDKDGALSEASFEALAKAGIPKEFVDAYINGQEALATQFRGQVFAGIGGEDNWTALSTWASKNVPAAELTAFNEVMDGGTIDQCKLAVAGLYSRFTSANGQDPKTLLGGGNGPTQGDTFRSVQEMTAAMRDPRYAKDPAYRQDVEDRLRRSEIMGVKHSR